MAASSPLGSVDPNALSMTSYDHTYPTPPTVPADSRESTPDQPSKKKRKAWGQPVPEIKAILPPRKRAKTAEEKEQRKNERILRNRRAADKSRQRQKAAVAELEAKQGRMEQENAMLRELVSRYESRFGVQNDFPTQFSISTSDDASAPSPLDLNNSHEETPDTSMTYDTPSSDQQEPTLVQNDSMTSLKHESPALAPTLNLIDDETKSDQTNQVASYDNSSEVSGMTQYPAVVLCDLQCQPDTLELRLSTIPSNQVFNLGLSQLLQMIQALTIFQAFSTSTLLPIYNLFQILAQRLATSSMEQTFSSILNNFPIIHSLISMPSTPTRPAVFRMKLLSRLLACSPLMARLLLAATDRALQQVVSEEGFAEDPDRRWAWSSLMTIKWVIFRLEKEHRKIRRQVEMKGKEQSQDHVMDGVDYGAVARSSRLWQGPSMKCNNIEESWAQMPEVH